jgi:hypothetical protein
MTALDHAKAAKTKDELLTVCATQYYDYDVNAEMSQQADFGLHVAWTATI